MSWSLRICILFLIMGAAGDIVLAYSLDDDDDNVMVGVVL